MKIFGGGHYIRLHRSYKEVVALLSYRCHSPGNTLGFYNVISQSIKQSGIEDIADLLDPQSQFQCPTSVSEIPQLSEFLRGLQKTSFAQIQDLQIDTLIV